MTEIVHPRQALVRRGLLLSYATLGYNSLEGLIAIAAGMVAGLSLVVMPLLARAKRQVAFAIGSGALVAEAQQTVFCTYLSAILLGGLVLNATLGRWWADPLAALIMVPIIAREGTEGIRGHSACGCPTPPPQSVA